MKYYIIAGEASGDLHASNLIKGLKKHDPEADIRAWGGELMEAQGAEIIKHYKDLAIMGFVEVLAHLKTIRKNFKLAKSDILSYNPDVLITVDFPGFNLRMVEWAKKQGIRTFHYISPNVWAWKKKRVYSMRKTIDKLFVILPFEKAFYKTFDMDVVYEGHPLLDAAQNHRGKSIDEFKRLHALDDRPLIAVLPGSRKQEISRMLPVMLNVAGRHPGYQYLIAGAPSIDDDFYRQLIPDTENLHLIHGATYDILRNSEAGMVCSGTATLEAGIFNLPQVVCYKTNKLTFAIARLFVKIRRFSLVNLILEKDSVRELIQHFLTVPELDKEFLAVCKGGEKREPVLQDYERLNTMLGSEGVSDRLAQKMIQLLQNED